MMKFPRAFRILLSSLLASGAGAFAEEGELSAATAMELDYVRSLHEDVLTKAKAPLVELDAKYQAAIGKLKDQAEAAGKSGVVAAAEASLKELAEGGIADGEAYDPDIAKAEKIYLDQRLKLTQQVQQALLKAHKDYTEQLNRMSVDLTKKDQVEDAALVKKQATAAAEALRKLMEQPVATVRKEARVPGVMPPSSVVIVKATYATWDKSADVTEKVRAYVAEMQDFSANPGGLGVDPNPGWNKGLQVVFEKDGKRREHNWGENGEVLYEAFAGPQDAEELKMWLIGTRWRYGREDIIFGIGGAVTKGRLIGKWTPDANSKFSVSWDEGDPIPYEFDGKWKQVTEKGTKERVFKRTKGL